MTDEQSSTETAQSAHKRTFRFVYRHSLELVAVSVAWFIASLPVVTLGPATLGAYAAVRSLRQTEEIDRAYIVRALRTNGIHAALLSFLPLVFVASAMLYLGGNARLGAFENIAAVVGVYVSGYLGVALIPTFYAMAGGETPIASLKQGYVWVATKPASTVTLALVTGTLFVVTALMTIGFVLLFPALTICYHVEVLADESADTQVANSPTPRPEEALT